MIMIRRLSSLVLGLLLSSTAAILPVQGTDVSEIEFGNDLRRAVSVKAGELLHVRLPAQPAAGFSWWIVSGNVTVVENRFEGRSDDARAGAPADQLFVLKAQEPGSVAAVFAYGRPWERNKEPVRKATLDIKVE